MGAVRGRWGKGGRAVAATDSFLPSQAPVWWRAGEVGEKGPSGGKRGSWSGVRGSLRFFIDLAMEPEFETVILCAAPTTRRKRPNCRSYGFGLFQSINRNNSKDEPTQKPG